MKQKIKDLSPDLAKNVLVDFFDVYFDKGFGAMNKTEIETLLYHVLRKNCLLDGKCFNDSYKLQIPETRARKLIYDSDIKYRVSQDEGERDAYIRKEIGKRLQRAHIIKGGKFVRFALDDKYLQVALNAKLRDNEAFADTSFNKDIICLDVESFTKMVEILVPNLDRPAIENKLADIAYDESKSAIENIRAFIDAAGSIASVASLLM